MARQWHMMDVREVLYALRTDADRGLDEKEAEARLARFGPNEAVRYPPRPLWRLFINQFRDFPVPVLLAATVLSGFLGEYTDALTIMMIVVIHAILGCVREYRAERSMEALKQLAAPEAGVIRNGRIRRVKAVKLVPGDIVVLEEGDRVPADARLVEAVNLETEEAALTGEPAPVRKITEAAGACPAHPWDIRNTVYMGTSVVRGRGLGVVTATGTATEMGHISVMDRDAGQNPTPLQKRMDQLVKGLAVLCALFCAMVVIMGVYRGELLYRMVMVGISLAVAAIPKGLPATVTVALAIGVQRMARRNAIVRKLPPVETLGCVTVICSGKTGTLTQNKMAVRKVMAPDFTAEIEGEGYDPKGEFRFTGGGAGAQFDMLLKAAALCNNSSLVRGDIKIGGLFRGITKGGGVRDWGIQGDPTEGALLVMAARGGYWRERLEQQEKRVAELPFDSDRKRMTVICRNAAGELTAYVKGAPDILLELCTHYSRNGRVQPLTDRARRQIMSDCADMARQAMRVLAFAVKQVAGEKADYSEEEEGLTFIGMCGMVDPPKPGVVSAVHSCRRAGLQVAMITGDHQDTARAVAGDIGLLAGGGKVLTGRELDRIPDDDLTGLSREVAVYARVSPRHKLRLVRALKRAGHVVAMTGDGVNDAPAVKEADIGIAMGISGTDATREASSVILADDNFATVVAAVEEGRAIYENIRKFIRYLLSCKAGEVLVMFLPVLCGLPLPLLPLQILWINLVTDGLPALALGVVPAHGEIMSKKPRDPGEGIIDRGLGWRVLGSGFFMAVVTLAIFVMAWAGSGELDLSRTAAFTTLVFTQLFFVLTCRSEHHSIFKPGCFTNPRMLAAVLCAAALQAAVIYLPFLQQAFHTVPLNALQWSVVLSAAALPAAAGIITRQVQLKARHKFTYLRV